MKTRNHNNVSGQRASPSPASRIPVESNGAVETKSLHENNGNGAAQTLNGESDTDPLPGAFAPSSEFYSAVKAKAKPIMLNEPFIKTAALSGATDGDVIQHETHEFYTCEVRATKDKVYRRVIHDIQENVASGEAHESKKKKMLAQTPPYVDDPEAEKKYQPLKKKDKVLIAVMLVLAAAFIICEAHNGMVFAEESGHEHLKKWWAALLFSVVPVTSLGVFLKMLSLLFQTEQGRRRFQFALGFIGCAAAIIAVPVFAMTYSAFAADPVAVLTGQTAAAAISPVKVIALQIFLCGLASASLIICAWQLIEQHCQSPKIENPAWRKIKDDLDALSEILRKDRELLGFAEGKLAQLEAERDKLIHDALRSFKALRLRHDLRQQHSSELLESSEDMLKKSKPNKRNAKQ